MSLQPGGASAFGQTIYDPGAMAMNAQQRPMLAMNGQQMLGGQPFLQHTTQPMLVNGAMQVQPTPNQMFNAQQQNIIRRQQALANAGMIPMPAQPMPGTPQINGGTMINQMRGAAGRPVSMMQPAQMTAMQASQMGMAPQMAGQMGPQPMYRAGVNPALAGRVQHMQPELAQQLMLRQSMPGGIGLSPAAMQQQQQQQRSVSAPHMQGQMQQAIGVPQAMPMPPQVHGGHHQPAQYAQHAALANGMQPGPQAQPPLNTATAPPTVPSAPPGPAGPGLVRRTPDPSFTAAANLQAAQHQQHQHLQQQAQYNAMGRPGTPQQPQTSPVRPPTVVNMHAQQSSPPQDHYPQQQQGPPHRAPSAATAQGFHQTPAQVLSASNTGQMQDAPPPEGFPPALVPSSQPQQHPPHQPHFIMQNGQPAVQHDQPGAMRPGQPQLARQQVNMVPPSMVQVQQQQRAYPGQPISQAAYMHQRTMSMNPPPQPQPIAVGSGIMRLFNFSTAMSREGPERYKHEYWTNSINQSFAAGAVFKLTLWKDNIAAEAKPFGSYELGLATLPRFFLVTSQSGVKSMTLTAEGAVERLGRAPNGAPNMTLDCAHATWTCRYTTGYTVTLRGPILASMSMQQDGVLRFDAVTFEAKHHEKHIIVDAIGRGTPNGATPATLHSSPSNSNTTKTDDSLETKTGLTPDDRTAVSDPNLPPDPVNGFGVPQATMRCLELAESVNVMEGLIQYADGMESYSPMESLRSLAEKIRATARPQQGHSNTSPPQPHTMPATPQQQPTPAPSGSHSTPHLAHATTQHGLDGSSSGTNTLQSALVIQPSPPRPPPPAAVPTPVANAAPAPPAPVPAPAPVASTGKRKNAPADGMSTTGEPAPKRVQRRNSRRGGG